MKRRLALVALASPAAWSQSDQTGTVEVTFPLRIATLSTTSPVPQVGRVIVLPDLADADRKVSTLLLQGVQSLGLLIESPTLDLGRFLLPDQEWRSNTVVISPAWIDEHNRFAAAPLLPSDRIYAVQYSGRYRYAASELRLALSIVLKER